MEDAPCFYRLLSPHSRLLRDATNKLKTVVYPVGTVIEPTADELRAFGDRLELVEAGDVPPDAVSLPPPQAPTAPALAVGTASDRRLNPELYAIIKRANTGTATADEQHVAVDILDYMEKHTQGTATADDTAALELVLTDFGLPLFVD